VNAGGGSGIASFHLVRHRGALTALTALATDRRVLDRVSGLVLWRLLGTGRGRRTSIGVDARRTALFAVWSEEAALDHFLASSTVAARWRRDGEVYSLRLRGLDGHGQWKGVDVLARVQPGTPGGPVAVLTRADVRGRHWLRFLRAGGPVSHELQGASGLLAVAGMGEAPLGKQATFSLWRTIDDARAFAYGSPRHVAVVRRARAEGWYGEELFACFEPYAREGTWDGHDPLA
jgi:hypothetical protein